MLRNLLMSVVCLCVSVVSAAEPLLVTDFTSFDDDQLIATMQVSDSLVALNTINGIPELEIKSACVKSARSFSQPMDAKFTWGYESDNSDTLRPEILTVAVRSTGKMKNGKLVNGVAVRFETLLGIISIVEYVDNKATVLNQTTVRLNSNPKESAIPRGNAQNWFKMRLRDDGKKLQMVVPQMDDLVLEAEYDVSKHPENRFVLHNELPPISDWNRSFFRNLVIKSND